MSEIGTGGSVYPVSLPTANELEFDKALANRTKPDAALLNDIKDNIVGIAAELGLSLKGSSADLATRLANYINNDGTFKNGLYVVGSASYPTIQSALTQAGTDSGGFIYIPAGEYAVTAELDVPANTTIMGAGRATILDCDALDDEHCFKLQSVDHVVIAGIYFKDLDEGSPKTDDRACITIGPTRIGSTWQTDAGSQYVLVHGCIFENVSTGVRANGGRKVIIQQNFFLSGNTNNTANAVRLTAHPQVGASGGRNVEHIIVTDNYFNGTDWASVCRITTGDAAATALRYSVFANNTIEDCTQAVDVGGSMNHCVIANNTIETCSQDAMEFEDSSNTQDNDVDHIIIADNVIRDAGSSHYCIYIRITRNGSNYQHFTITGNQMDGGNSSLGGIFINNGGNDYTGNHIISNNKTFDMANAGIIVKAVRDCVINNNHSVGNTWDGITIIDTAALGSKLCTVVGNVCTLNERDGIRVQGEDSTTSRITITGNQCNYNNIAGGLGGIALIGTTGVDKCTIMGNICTDDQGSPTQDCGVHIANSNCNKNIIMGNILTPNEDAPIEDSGTDTKISHNITVA